MPRAEGGTRLAALNRIASPAGASRKRRHAAATRATTWACLPGSSTGAGSPTSPAPAIPSLAAQRGARPYAGECRREPTYVATSLCRSACRDGVTFFSVSSLRGPTAASSRLWGSIPARRAGEAPGHPKGARPRAGSSVAALQSPTAVGKRDAKARKASLPAVAQGLCWPGKSRAQGPGAFSRPRRADGAGVAAAPPREPAVGNLHSQVSVAATPASKQGLSPLERHGRAPSRSALPHANSPVAAVSFAVPREPTGEHTESSLHPLGLKAPLSRITRCPQTRNLGPSSARVRAAHTRTHKGNGAAES